MRASQLLALLAVSASAAPQDPKPTSIEERLDVPAGVTDGLEIGPEIVGKTVFDIVLDVSKPDGKRKRGPVSARDISNRQAPPEPPKAISAEEGSKIKAPGGGKAGLFYRGDSRPPSEIFASGFTPQGQDTSLQHHLEFKGDSGFVSLSRSPESAERYAFGRSADNNQKGYIYVVAPKDVPDGHWIPGIYSPDKNPEVRRNQEFAVAGAVPGSSVSHAYEVTRDKPSARSNKIRNEGYSLKSAGRCVLQRKRAAACDPAGWIDNEEPKKTPPGQTGPKDDEEPKKTPPGQTGPEDSEGEKNKNKNNTKGKGKGGLTGQKITESKFLQFLTELDPEFLRPLVEAIQAGEITVADVQLAFKRALSETMGKRWADFGSGDKAAETLKNIVVDIFATARYATPPGFWQDVAKNLPGIAKEISKGKTPEEKLKIANKDINEVVSAWSYTPVGLLNENIMKEVAEGTAPVKAVALSVNKLWSYTPLGWLINLIAPVDSWIRNIKAREELLTLGAP